MVHAEALAIEEGQVVTRWVHQTVLGEPIPCEMTLKRVAYKNGFRLFSYLRDLRQELASQAEARAAEENTRQMLDSSPLACDLWDDQGRMIACNAAAIRLFGLTTMQDCCANWDKLSVPIQPDGQRSEQAVMEYVTRAREQGQVAFFWWHQSIDGDLIPAEVTLKKIEYKGSFRIISFIRDLREELAAKALVREADERNQLMIDVTPIGFTFWDDHFKLLDCNDAALKTFDVPDKQTLIQRFHDLFPECQENGVKSSKVLSDAMEQTLIAGGRHQFEWLQRKLDGTPMPVEVTLIRVDFKGSQRIAGYIRDLRQQKAVLEERRLAESKLIEAKELAEECDRHDPQIGGESPDLGPRTEGTQHRRDKGVNLEYQVVVRPNGAGGSVAR